MQKLKLLVKEAREGKILNNDTQANESPELNRMTDDIVLSDDTRMLSEEDRAQTKNQAAILFEVVGEEGGTLEPKQNDAVIVYEDGSHMMEKVGEFIAEKVHVAVEELKLEKELEYEFKLDVHRELDEQKQEIEQNLRFEDE